VTTAAAVPTGSGPSAALRTTSAATETAGTPAPGGLHTSPALSPAVAVSGARLVSGAFQPVTGGPATGATVSGTGWVARAHSFATATVQLSGLLATGHYQVEARIAACAAHDGGAGYRVRGAGGTSVLRLVFQADFEGHAMATARLSGTTSSDAKSLVLFASGDSKGNAAGNSGSPVACADLHTA